MPGPRPCGECESRFTGCTLQLTRSRLSEAGGDGPGPWSNGRTPVFGTGGGGSTPPGPMVDRTQWSKRLVIQRDKHVHSHSVDRRATGLLRSGRGDACRSVRLRRRRDCRRSPPRPRGIGRHPRCPPGPGRGRLGRRPLPCALPADPLRAPARARPPPHPRRWQSPLRRDHRAAVHLGRRQRGLGTTRGAGVDPGLAPRAAHRTGVAGPRRPGRPLDFRPADPLQRGGRTPRRGGGAGPRVRAPGALALRRVPGLRPAPPGRLRGSGVRIRASALGDARGHGGQLGRSPSAAGRGTSRLAGGPARLRGGRPAAVDAGRSPVPRGRQRTVERAPQPTGVRDEFRWGDEPPPVALGQGHDRGGGALRVADRVGALVAPRGAEHHPGHRTRSSGFRAHASAPRRARRRSRQRGRGGVGSPRRSRAECLSSHLPGHDRLARRTDGQVLAPRRRDPDRSGDPAGPTGGHIASGAGPSGGHAAPGTGRRPGCSSRPEAWRGRWGAPLSRTARRCACRGSHRGRTGAS